MRPLPLLASWLVAFAAGCVAGTGPPYALSAASGGGGGADPGGLLSAPRLAGPRRPPPERPPQPACAAYFPEDLDAAIAAVADRRGRDALAVQQRQLDRLTGASTTARAAAVAQLQATAYRLVDRGALSEPEAARISDLASCNLAF